jgi:hypothetical protein
LRSSRLKCEIHVETYLETYFGKNPTVGMADWHDIKAGETRSWTPG